MNLHMAVSTTSQENQVKDPGLFTDWMLEFLFWNIDGIPRLYAYDPAGCCMRPRKIFPISLYSLRKAEDHASSHVDLVFVMPRRSIKSRLRSIENHCVHYADLF